MKKVKRLPPPDIEDEPLPDDMLKQMQPARDVLPDILAGRKPLGRPRKSMPKKLVSLRIDADVLAAYRAIGEGWQTKINETLRNGEVQAQLGKAGFEAKPGSPQDAAAFIAAEAQRWTVIAKAAGVRGP